MQEPTSRAIATCPDHPLFPGEPPPEDFFVLFELLAAAFIAMAALGWLAARLRPSIMKSARVCLRLALALMLIGLPFLIPFLRRNTAAWKELQRAIQVREAALRNYQLAHPSWTNPQLVKGFLAQNSMPMELRFTDANIPPVHFKVSDWRDSAPRIVIAYNDCNNAVFDSRTMWVEVSD